eukprot:6018409-Pleurochrysis_carterae.AAC.3
MSSSNMLVLQTGKACVAVSLRWRRSTYDGLNNNLGVPNCYTLPQKRQTHPAYRVLRRSKESLASVRYSLNYKMHLTPCMAPRMRDENV